MKRSAQCGAIGEDVAVRKNLPAGKGGAERAGDLAVHRRDRGAQPSRAQPTACFESRGLTGARPPEFGSYYARSASSAE